MVHSQNLQESIFNVLNYIEKYLTMSKNYLPTAHPMLPEMGSQMIFLPIPSIPWQGGQVGAIHRGD